jgi:hypothetical protein
MATKINLVDSHTGVMWLRHLDWMAQHRGQLIWLIYEGEQLVEYLNSFVAHCVQLRGGIMTRDGLTSDEAELQIKDKLLSQFTQVESSLTAMQYQEIKDFIATLEPNTATVEV